MDDYQGDKNIKKESAGDEARLNDTSSILDVSQTIHHLLAMSSMAGGAILSPMQLLQASGSSGANTSQLSIPWSMLPHHYQQMMVLQQGLGQPFLMSDVIDDKEGGHVVIMPTGVGDQTSQYNNISAVSSPAVAASGRAIYAGGGQMQGAGSMIGQQNQSVVDSNGRLLNYHTQSLQGKAATKEEMGVAQMMARNSSMNAAAAAAARGTSSAVRHHGSDSAKMPRPRPPKKPLTPYMLFSKEMWHQVKAANSHLSLVTEIGAIIGSMWRELDAGKKEHYNELFSRDKIRYDEEIRSYLKNNNLHPSDLIRARLSKKKDSKVTNQHRPSQAASSHASPAAILNPPGQQLVQSLLGYPIVDGSHASLVNLDGQLSNNLMQAWAGQPVQQILAQMGLTAGQLIHSDETGNEDMGAATQPLALQTHPMNLYSNANVCGTSEQSLQPTSMTRSSNISSIDNYVSAVESGIDATCKSKSWPWSGQRQNQDDVTMQANAAAAIMYAVSAAVEREKNDMQSTGDNQLLGHSGEWTQIKLESSVASDDGNPEQIRLLETRVICLENALTEKNKEIDVLTTRLEEAHHIIAQFRLPDPEEEEGSTENEAPDRNGGDHNIAVVSGSISHL